MCAHQGNHMHKGMTLRESCPACGARPLDPMMAGLTYGRSQSVLESPETGRKPDRCNVPNKRHWNRKSFFHRSLDTQEQLSPFLRAHQLLAVPQRWTLCFNQQVTWNSPITAPSVLFQIWIASGVGSNFTWHLFRSK